MRATPDTYICGSYLPSSITRGSGGIGRFIRSSLGDFGHNGRGFLTSTFAIFLPPRGRQWRMAPKAARGSRSKPGPQERRPLDPQPLVRGGITKNSGFGNTGGGDSVPEGRQPAFGNSAALGQTHKAKNGAKQIGEKEEVVTIPGCLKPSITQPLWGAVLLEGTLTLVQQNRLGMATALVSVFCVGGNALAAVSEGEIDRPLYAPGSQSNVGLAQEVVTGAGYCEQAAAVACLLPSTDPATSACTPEATRDHRQGRGDLLVQGEPGENFFSLSDQSQDSEEDSTCPSIDSESGDSSTAPLTPISALRGTVVKHQAKQTVVLRRDKAGESSQKREKKKKKVSRSRAMSWDYTETQQLLHSMGDLSVAPAQTEVNVLNVETVPPSPSLHLIYQTITSQHKQTQRDSKKARVATKQLQVAVSKVAKTCSEIGERIAAIECRADALESDLGVVSKQAAMHESQLSDIQWKVEDFENRQRRNNLRLIGIQEGENLFSDERDERMAQYLSDMSSPKLPQEEGCRPHRYELQELLNSEENLKRHNRALLTGPELMYH
ncbi:hypothetical protein NDU88_004585 [Pleurodeles waltl]|uniref:Uncharacterized protein n=1 Tax=Pleurodeles waltl TaxID=8319 RepID=A0AAV7L1U6_PLEWA|nr:hypothetical protein NDU88_004585 [Pleurodeles waltl]